MVEKQEPRKKLTLSDLLIKHSDHLRELAQCSALHATRVQAMLLNTAVTLPEAQAILAAFNRLHQTSYSLDDLDVQFVEHTGQHHNPLSPAPQTRPTFQQLCQHAGVSWLEVSRGAGVPDVVGYRMYKGAAVFVEDCDDLLAVLSALTEQSWTREQVGGLLLRTDSWNNPRLPAQEWTE
jgi:hypothetical protein